MTGVASTATAPLRVVRLVGTLLAGALTLVACGSSGFTYVKSSPNNTYFKVPKQWTVYDKDDILAVAQLPGGEAKSESIRFVAIFDADPNPSLTHDLQTATHPFGLAQVRELGIEERDSFSLAALRNEVIPIDEILNREVGRVELVERPRSIVRDGGLAGTRLVYTVHTKEGSFTVHQTGLVDAETRRVYFFIVGCEASCFNANRKTIAEIADSWTIKES